MTPSKSRRFLARAVDFLLGPLTAGRWIGDDFYMDTMHEIEIAMSPLPRPARLPGWRSMLEARRAEKAALVMFDKMAEREAATLSVHAATTVCPPRRVK